MLFDFRLRLIMLLMGLMLTFDGLATTYDIWGRLIQSNTPIAHWSYAYDDNGNRLSSTLSYNNGQQLTARYEYNTVDHLTKMIYPSGKVLNYQVDSLGRVKKISQTNRAIVRDASYHPNNTVKTLSLGNNHYYHTDIDNRQMLSQISAAGIRLNYSYDRVGNVNSIRQTGQASKTLYYDGLNRLRRVNYGNGGVAAFSYDQRSNLLQKRLNSVQQTSSVNWSYGYDNHNRLTQINGSNYRFVYDSRGNVISDGRHTYSYFPNNRLFSVDGNARNYYYDANDKRLAIGRNGHYEMQFYDGDTLLGEYQFNGTPIREYVQLGNHTIAEMNNKAATDAESITYLYKDALGSTVAKADSRGKILWQENRLPFGKNTKLNDNQIEANPLQYTNAPLDNHSGLTYLQARDYNAEIGRFYAVDQKWYDSEDPQSFGRYTYVSNNPYKYTDPTGLDKWSVVSRQSNYTEPMMSDAAGEVMANVAGATLTPVGFAQEYVSGGFNWSMAMSVIPGVSEVRKVTKITKITKKANPYVSNNATLDKLSFSEKIRIQNAANFHDVDITVVGSRVNPDKPLTSVSDWDFVVQGNHKKRKNVAKSLPGSKNIKTGISNNQDIYKGRVDKDRPHAIFSPEDKNE